VRKSPADVGQRPDGDSEIPEATAKRNVGTIVDPVWASTEWTLGRATRTDRFWWIVLGYFLALVAWYAIQVHQTKYLVEVGFTPVVAAWALGAVNIVAIPGQILLGALSDRIGREGCG
jgi:sugar phosphate permease